MFRERQKLKVFPSSKVSFTSTQVDDSGNVFPVDVDSVVPMPSPENFRLRTLLKAGVSLEQVNTKLFVSDVVNLPSNSKPVETKPVETKSSETKPAEA